MRYVGWVLGGLYLADGIMDLVGGKGLIKRTNAALGKRLPSPVEKSLKKATDVNDTAIKAMGINNVIAGAGMLLVATLVGPLFRKG